MRYIALAIVLLPLILAASAIGNLPIGYLHSWNQITTLSIARGIERDGFSWLRPTEMTTRISSLPPRGSAEDPSTFVIYEESPLYPVLSVALSKTGLPLHITAKILSLSSFGVFVACFFLVARRSVDFREATVSVFLLLSSFPYVYYAQATMSDMSMMAFLFVGLALLIEDDSNKPKTLAAATAFAISALFKSYSVLFGFVLILGAKRKQIGSSKRNFDFNTTLALSIVSLPVLSWHTFSFFQPGHQEMFSHSAFQKVEALISLNMIETLWKMYWRYLGYVGGFFTLVSVLTISRRRISSNGVWWFMPYSIASLIFLIATADKILFHDYYFLLAAPILFMMAGTHCIKMWDQLGSFPKTRMTVLVCLSLLTVVASSNAVYKAVSENPDVRACATLAERTIPPHAIMATWTDVSRYNSLAYLSGHRSINVEEQFYPLERYASAGAQFLLLDMEPAESQNHLRWIEQSGATLKGETSSNDFRGRPRICLLFQL